MRDPRIRIGVLLGLLAAPLLFAGAGAAGERGAVLSDCDGEIRELVVQWVMAAASRAGRTFREFLSGLGPEVTVHVVVPDEAAWRSFQSSVGRVPPNLRPVLVGHAMTCWSRDRWLALSGRGGTTLLLPAEEDGASAWPARAGDALVGADLAGALAGVRAVKSPLAFDGGDFAADREAVFVTPALALRNGAAGLREALERSLGRRVIVLDRAPPHHAGMFLMPVGNRRVLVGDPSLARPLVEGGPDPNPVGTDFSEETQALFDAVAERAAAEGYEVFRMPVLPGKDGRTWLTPLNVILDDRPDGRVVHLPVYRGAERMNAAAAGIWRGLGYEVRPVDCTDVFPLFGSLRCLVSVLGRVGNL